MLNSIFRVGLFTNGNNDFYFDDLVIKAYNCQSKWEVNPTVILETNSSTVYEEIFDQSFVLK